LIKLLKKTEITFWKKFLAPFLLQAAEYNQKDLETLKKLLSLNNLLNKIQKITFKDFKCFIISIGLFITYTAFIALIIILAELLIEPPYLKDITSDELQKHILL